MGNFVRNDTERELLLPNISGRIIGFNDRRKSLAIDTLASTTTNSEGRVRGFRCVTRPGMPIKQHVEAPAFSRAFVAPSSEAPARPGRTILVVEDEPALRRFLATALQDDGYEVVQVASAEHALKIFAAGETVVELLLSDVGLPGASGTSLVAQVRVLRPNLPSLLMSAWDRTDLVERGLLPAGIAFLQKPFGVDELLGEIHARLEPAIDH